MIQERVYWAVALTAYARKYDAVDEKKLTWQQKYYQKTWDDAHYYLQANGWSIDQSLSSALKTGIAYVTYVNDTIGAAVLGFRGSVNAVDWFQNIFGDTGIVAMQGFTVESRQGLLDRVIPQAKEFGFEEPFSAAIEAAERVIARYTGCFIGVSGHSRGGAQAMYVGMKLGIPAVTFNPAPLPKSIDLSMCMSSSKQIRNFYVEDDVTYQAITLNHPVNFLENYAIYGEYQFSAIQNRKSDDPGKVVQLLLDNHSMKMFVFNQVESVITLANMTENEHEKVADLNALREHVSFIEQLYRKKSSRIKEFTLEKIDIIHKVKSKYLSQFNAKIKIDLENAVDQLIDELSSYEENSKVFKNVLVQLDDLYTKITQEL